VLETPRCGRTISTNGSRFNVFLCAASLTDIYPMSDYPISADERALPQAVVPMTDPGHPMDQLAKPRNDAAHGGQAPDKTGVENAMTVATSIVRTATPLPPPTV